MPLTDLNNSVATASSPRTREPATLANCPLIFALNVDDGKYHFITDGVLHCCLTFSKEFVLLAIFAAK